MALPRVNPTHTKAWKKLQSHYDNIKNQNINDWFKANPNRASDFQIDWNSFFVDFSKNRINTETIDLLVELAEEVKLAEAIDQQFSGEQINETEKRAVGHVFLRQKNKSEEVQHTLQRMKTISDAVSKGDWKGYTGKKITDIVNIGIGGSDLGPRMAVEALSHYHNQLQLHFISNVDGDCLNYNIKQLNPETTLCIIVSKSFSTIETMMNADLYKNWFLEKLPKAAFADHFIAVTTNIDKALNFGVDKSHILPMWDWVGGRFSLWSGVGLSISCAIGFNNFEKLLYGAQKMDEHFKNTPFRQNIPVILGLLSVWYTNFFKAESHAVIPYSFYLNKLVPYLQQAFMESNGKNMDRNGKKISYQTGSVIWGSPGSNAQHAFFQLLHQGTKLIPADFIGFIKPINKREGSHNQLMANFFAQTEALLKGKTKEQVLKDNPNKSEKISAYKTFEGNKPSTTILIDQLTPENLGSLLAMYEHQIFVEGIIWNIYSYDQWGVELGKQLANGISKNIESKSLSPKLDSSTSSLLKRYIARR